MATVAIDSGSGHWVRFTRYEIADGAIQPARAAETEWWSPWARRAGDPPYQTLVNLVRELPSPLGTAGEARLLEWITAHGVLGVLPHETVAATLWPRWRLASEYSEPGKDAPLLPCVTTYHHVGGRFEQHARAFRTPSSAAVVERDGEARLHGEPVVDAKILHELRREGWSEPEVIRRPIGDALVVEPLGRAWGRYFLKPGLKDEIRTRWRYPAPLSADFWGAYVEPLDEFLRAAHQLRQAIAELADAPHGYERAGGETLSRLIAPMGLDLVFGADGLREAWRGPSLLSMLAAMAALDVARGGRAHRCVCGKLFVDDDQRVEYCSARCRWRAHQRTYRARKLAKAQAKTKKRTTTTRRKR